jgi:hypothetical protein
MNERSEQMNTQGVMECKFLMIAAFFNHEHYENLRSILQIPVLSNTKTT